MDTAFFLQNSIWLGAAVGSGCMLAYSYWRERGMPEVLSPLGATQLINREDAQVLDVRSANEYAAGHIVQARHIEIAELANRVAELNVKYPVLIVGSEAVAGRARKLLQAAGLRAYAIEGGLGGWLKAGLPVEK